MVSFKGLLLGSIIALATISVVRAASAPPSISYSPRSGVGAYISSPNSSVSARVKGFHNPKSGVVVRDPDYTIKSYYDSATRKSGFSLDEMVGGDVLKVRNNSSPAHDNYSFGGEHALGRGKLSWDYSIKDNHTTVSTTQSLVLKMPILPGYNGLRIDFNNWGFAGLKIF